MRKATLNDIDHLVELMAEFYAEADLSLDRGRAAQAFGAILAEHRLGWIGLIEKDARIVGYLVVTVCFSMEYGGRVAFVDDFFVKPAFRGLGLGTHALAEARESCASSDIRGMAVETGHDNAGALTVYRRAGFLKTNRQLLRLGIANPLHVED